MKEIRKKTTLTYLNHYMILIKYSKVQVARRLHTHLKQDNKHTFFLYILNNDAI